MLENAVIDVRIVYSKDRSQAGFFFSDESRRTGLKNSVMKNSNFLHINPNHVAVAQKLLERNMLNGRRQ